MAKFSAKDSFQISTSDFLGIQIRQHTGGLVIQINGAVLLAAAADGEDVAERDAVLFHFGKSKSSASAHINGELCLTSGLRLGRTPFAFLYCGSAWSKFSDLS